MYEFGLNYAKLQKSGLLETMVPVPLCLVPVPNTFCKLVPVPLVLVVDPTRSTDRRDSLLNGRKNVKRKCGLIFEFWKIRPQGGTVLLWSRHLLLFLFLSGENQVRTKNPNDSGMEKSGLRKLDFWVRGSDYLSGR